ncbi:hypothetical protein T10_507 [Trichinella papuae]|uniref:Uncharacterized protein n=1 Tax=Trichinella papuae TaxID=268474 RepID=A0A0V1MIU3_9BILA|nr:hypothetical protein T10_507 [Trichinella papuae]
MLKKKYFLEHYSEDLFFICIHWPIVGVNFGIIYKQKVFVISKACRRQSFAARLAFAWAIGSLECYSKQQQQAASWICDFSL